MKKGIKLQTLVCSSIVFSMLVLAITLTSQSYLSSRSLLISQQEVNTKLLAKTIDEKVAHLTQSVIGTVRLLQLDPVNHFNNLSNRLSRLSELTKTLEVNPVLSAVYVGYANGDFLLLRSIKNQAARDRVNAPDNTSYILQSIERLPTGKIKSQWRFYNAALHILETRNIPKESFDPRTRPWYTKARMSSKPVLTDPYVFYTTKEIGVTIALNNPAQKTVVGVDFSVDDLSDVLKSLRPAQSNLLLLMGKEKDVIAYPDTKKLIIEDKQHKLRLAKVEELGIPVLSKLSSEQSQKDTLAPISVNSESWYGARIPIQSQEKSLSLELLFATPEKVLLAKVDDSLVTQLYWSCFIIILLLIFGWFVGRSISRPLLNLSHNVNAFTTFDFSKSIPVSSSIKEVNLLSNLTRHMANAIQNFQSISKELSRDKDLEQMLSQISEHLIAITSSEAGIVYLHDPEKAELILATSTNNEAPASISYENLSPESLQTYLRSIFSKSAEQLLITPLVDRNDRFLGVLILFFSQNTILQTNSFQQFVEEISGSAATAIETRRQVESQQALIEAIIVLLADAIDAKSPYTSGHCERVPMLAEMILDAAESSSQSIFSDFKMNDSERQEFRIAAWLHDCGKITSPEYVVDKATKLETIYNRIHEVRTRFEVLWRDLEIDYLNGVLLGGDKQELKRQKESHQALLQEEFAFVAKSNTGGEFMPDEDIEKLQSIASHKWMRHFDSSIGLSREEFERLPEGQSHSLPVEENLLSDKIEHIIGWGDRRPPVEKDNPDNTWGFDMSLPDQAFNHGEIYNLSVKRGTLTTEERFAINDHMVQTIKMLTSLPFPENLKRVPDIAGNHHEKVDGTGYPRRLHAGNLSIPERIMAVADIFEALTAADRPYKDAKTLSESLRILAFMAKDKHIDKDVFKLFVESKAYLRYAESFLKPSQIDNVDMKKLFDIAQISNKAEEALPN